MRLIQLRQVRQRKGWGGGFKTLLNRSCGEIFHGQNCEKRLLEYGITRIRRWCLVSLSNFFPSNKQICKTS